MHTFPDVDTRDADAVSAGIREHLWDIDPNGDIKLFEDVYALAGEMFRGEVGDFRPVDLKYHDYQHTLQASLCMAEILAGRHRAQATPSFTWRQCMIGMRPSSTVEGEPRRRAFRHYHRRGPPTQRGTRSNVRNTNIEFGNVEDD